MLNVKGMSGVGAISAYLSNSDYYSEGEKITGQWMGRGAEMLGLQGAVNLADLQAVLQGNDPRTGEYLKPRHNSDSVVERVGKNGEIISDTRKARNMYDCVLSAPKALAVLQVIDPEAANRAHDKGVAAAAEVMERLADARIRKGGANETRNTSNLVIARYDHLTTRAADPGLHSHLAVANITFDAVEGQWKALSPQEIYAQKAFVTAVYRNASAAALHDDGYQTYARQLKGQYNGYGIVGIEESTLEKFSKRTKEKEDAVQKFTLQNGRAPSKNEIALIVKETRDNKIVTTNAEVLAAITKQFSSVEVAANEKLVSDAKQRGSVREHGAAASSLDFAVEHTFERVCTAKDWELKTAALDHHQGSVDLAELEGRLAAKIARGEMLSARGEVATDETLERERRMVAVVNAGIGQFEPLGRGREFVATASLKEGQRAAVERALASRDFVFNISGSAGVGKTTLLKELELGLKEARRSIVAVAPSTAAVEQLHKDGFPNAFTIAELKISPQKQAELRGQVLVIDEAGMVGSKDMDELLRLAKKHGARVLPVGDVKQIKAVDAGDALRILQQHSDMAGANVNEIVRQRDPAVRAALQALRTNPALGYERLEKLGSFREVHWRDRFSEITSEYLKARTEINAKGERSSVLVIAGTHEEIKNITHAIRSGLKSRGELGQGRDVDRLVDLKWTEAQRKTMSGYKPGQILTFHRQTDVAKKNESLEVVSSDKRSLTARRENGNKVKLTAEHAKSFGVFEKEVMEVAAGDKLLLQANWKDRGRDAFKATNGELVTVASVDNQGKIRLDDGRELPATYKQFASGYAITAHKSQGATSDIGIVSGDGMGHDSFYVAVSRSREQPRIISSDLLGVQEAIGVSADRQSAIELAQRAAEMRSREQHYEAQRQAPDLLRKTAQIERAPEKENYAISY
jgi:conjugative relaxase-like TrwC/TraI family protein